ncbi:hypothetical protein T11_3778, partial [Trichinella zimbabwensis]
LHKKIEIFFNDEMTPIQGNTRRQYSLGEFNSAFPLFVSYRGIG